MKANILRSAVAATVMSGVMLTSYVAPARANGTTNTIIGVAAGIAAIATAVNVAHKNQVAHTVEGYLPDGSVVYEDGHAVAPNGYSWYPGNQGQQIACNDQQCTIYGNGQYGHGYNNNGPYYGNSGYNGGWYGNDGYYGNNDNDGDEYYGSQNHHRRPPNT
jgi:hypothetical protein